MYFIKSGLLFLAAVAVGILSSRGTARRTSSASPSGGADPHRAGAGSGWTYLKWVTTNFVITTDRLIYRHGVLSKHGIEIPLERVNTVFFSQSILERMVGSGDLVIESAGELGRQNFSNVRKPSAVQNEIHKQMEANENRKFDRVNAAPRPAHHPRADRPARRPPPARRHHPGRVRPEEAGPPRPHVRSWPTGRRSSRGGPAGRARLPPAAWYVRMAASLSASVRTHMP